MTSPGTPLPKYEVDAYVPFLASVSVPLLKIEGTGYVVRGTGTLVRIGDALLLVSARHVLVDEDVGKPVELYTPAGRGTETQRIHGETVWAEWTEDWPDSEKVDNDVAFVRLRTDVASILQSRRWLTLANLNRSRKPLQVDDFLLCGYACEQHDLKAGFESLKNPLTVRTCPWHGGTSGFVHFDPQVHLLLQYGERAFNYGSDKHAPLPRLPGISGCSVWARIPSDDTSSPWTAEKDLALVAIEVSWDGERRRWIKAIHWGMILAFIRKYYPDLVAEIERHFGAEGPPAADTGPTVEHKESPSGQEHAGRM